jgi:hypothetical protein
MESINRAMTSKISLILFTVLAGLYLGIGFLLFIGGGVAVGILTSDKLFALSGGGYDENEC